MIRRVGISTIIGVLVVLAGLAPAAPVTLAILTSSGTTTASLQTASLAPATALSGVTGTTAALSWTPSVSSGAAGYNLLRSATSGSGYGLVAPVTPVSASSTTDTPHAGTWYYMLQTYFQSWSSVNSNQASVVVAAGSTGYKGCTSNAPETMLSGDNNGYETNPGNACAQDGVIATDATSGTDTVNSCSDTGKDRHHFWGYSFGLPANPTSIDGITLHAVVGENNTNGTTLLCAQLSWDSGTTWTTAKSVAITGTALTTYTLGSAADTWGHAGWTPTQLGTPTFQVRITDVSTVSGKTFKLDYLGFAVQFTP